MAGLRRRQLGRRAAMAALLGATSCHSPAGALSRTEPLGGAVRDMALRPLGVLSINTQQLGTHSLSGLHVGADLTLTAVCDRGNWARARLVLAADGAPLRLENPSSGPLRDPAGRSLPRGALGDAECLAALPDGSWLVGFERLHRIWRYQDIDGPARPVDAPEAIRRQPYNAGLESLGVLPDGCWLMISEGHRIGMDATLRTSWIGRPGRWHRLNYRTSPGYDPSDLCPLPDGGALVLERRFHPFNGDWFSARIKRIPPIGTAPDLLEGQLVAELAPPLPTDNWEGISAFLHDGRPLVAIVSDDNDMPFQRSLLMVLGWADQAMG
ncbi:esterase-like activity of phytase family protein [Roseomonas sp. SSH11]|uniref:Esterase-like activity of phytase family protein n=1 Tax=Pararoseomonas baculiformis TaxID=2820812 RepID=A0ABS4AB28_9PROT|nr:esterase-like activity of phytase family protein [Pararoseomonas baculiformis]MBP0444215.1 esterase-like activity of phytase family protein [Pararoseomonas baculiformis]